jgi:hypothetical protein
MLRHMTPTNIQRMKSVSMLSLSKHGSFVREPSGFWKGLAKPCFAPSAFLSGRAKKGLRGLARAQRYIGHEKAKELPGSWASINTRASLASWDDRGPKIRPRKKIAFPA